MNTLLRHIVTLSLTIGILFLTTDCETYFSYFHPQFVTQTAPVEQSGDVEHTHISHHIVNDLFAERIEILYLSESSVILKAGSPLPSFQNNYYTCIFQPPKYS
jgi:hypothetical protein